MALAVVAMTGCKALDGDPVPFVPGGGAARPLEAVVVADRPPPPISGGTLLVSEDGQLILASDPDRDAVWMIRPTGEIVARLELADGAEPGRIAEDARGDFHVVLRRGGSVAYIQRATQTIAATRSVCAAPRGIDYERSTDAMLVACEGGELISVATDGAVTMLDRLERDLRDVVVVGTTAFVSRFRSAEIYRYRLSSGSADKLRIADVELGTFGSGLSETTKFRAHVAWRMIEDPNQDGVLVLHQRASTAEIPSTLPGVNNTPVAYYGGGGCTPSIVMGGITRVALTGPPDTTSPLTHNPIAGMPLPVDIAVHDNQISVAAAGHLNTTTPAALGTFVVPSIAEFQYDAESMPTPCRISSAGSAPTFDDGRQVVAVAYLPDGRTVAQSRDPWRVEIYSNGSESAALVQLQGADRKDSGHDLFHEDSGAGLACASCHAEGGDDGHTWLFGDLGERRTQDMRGGILDTAPFHWAGDMDTFRTLMNEVFSGRMSGPVLQETHIQALGNWVDSLPAPTEAAPFDLEAADRGRILFASSETECASCHSGPRLSNNESFDVGTGEVLQVPSLLGVGSRQPLMHDGCAETLAARFGSSCGGGDAHGKTSHLTDAQIGDLVAYMRTL